MKNILFLQPSTILLLLCTLFTNSLLANNDPKTPVATLGSIKNESSGTDDYVKISVNDSCDTEIVIQVYLTNLEDILIPGPPHTYTLAPNYPPMYLSFSIAGYPTVIQQLVEFEQIENPYNTQPLFRSLAVANYDFSGECIAIPESGGEPVPNFEFFLELELLQLDAGVYSTYDACAYAGEDDIFSCSFFKYAGNCPGDPIPSGGNSNLGGNTTGAQSFHAGSQAQKESSNGETFNFGPADCRNEGLTSKRVDFKAFCEACELSAPNASILGLNAPTDLPESTAFPNPFSDQVSVQWSTVNSMESVTLLDLYGKVLRQWSSNELKELTTLEINTNDLPKGVYFIHLQEEATESKTLKVIKQ